MIGTEEWTRRERLLQLSILALSAWSALFGRYTLAPMQEDISHALQLSDNQMALLQGSAVAIPMAIGAIPMGLIIDRFSRAWLFKCCAVVNIIAVLLAALAFNFALLFAARFLTGLSMAAALVAVYAVVADLYSPAFRGRATMIIALGEICSAPVAYALGGALLMRAGPVHSGLDGWRWALLLMCICLLPVLGLAFLFREPPRTNVMVKRPSLRTVWPRLWRYRGIALPLLSARVMVWIADGAVLIWGAPIFARRFALPPSQIGAIMGAALLVSGILGPIVGGAIADLCQRKGGPRRTVMAMGLLTLLSAPAAFFPVMPTAAVAGMLLTVFLSLGYTVNIAAMTLATIVVPADIRGLFVAVTITGAAIFCVGVAPLIVSALSTALGGPMMLALAVTIVCVATSIAGAVVFITGRTFFPDSVGMVA
jgi:MFS family permease